MADVGGILKGIMLAIYAMFSLDKEQCKGRWTEPDFQGKYQWLFYFSDFVSDCHRHGQDAGVKLGRNPPEPGSPTYDLGSTTCNTSSTTSK